MRNAEIFQKTREGPENPSASAGWRMAEGGTGAVLVF